MLPLPPPSKAWGQNYLKNRGVVEKIVKLLPLEEGCHLVEIGAGRGALTKALLQHPIRLTALEPHDASRAFLTQEFSAQPVRFLNEDATLLDYSRFAAHATVGNLPYNVASRILFALLQSARGQSRWVLMFQREMAERIVSPPGKKSYGALSVLVQLLTSAELVFHVSPGSFFPVPKVESSVVVFTPHLGHPEFATEGVKRLLQKLFSRRRKTLRNALSPLLPRGVVDPLLRDLPLSPHWRPEKLTPGQFQLLISTVLQYKGGSYGDGRGAAF